ncbi:DNA cytosine methyltransferase [Candidatus Poribacteria bacterium]|nr:DNA cytosine methyltransferase [Candidatus Poribacteria bacterium]
MDELTFIDLFAGAGGLSEGFWRKGFTSLAHIEKDLHSCLTFKTRISYYYLRNNNKLDVYSKYLKGELSRENLYNHIPLNLLNSVIPLEITEDSYNIILEKINRNLKICGYKKVDVIVGGPPCQTYSVVGRCKDRYGKKRDPRNHLYKLYSRFLEDVKPSIFVFENVPGLLSVENGHLLKDVMNHFHTAGYKVEDKILNSYDFGVLQKRERVILIGWKKELPFHYPDFEKQGTNKWSVKDVLSDLPSIQPGEKMLYGNYISELTGYLREYKIRTDNDILTLHIARGHNARDRQIYKLAIEKWEKERRRLKYTDVPEEFRTHKNLKSFLDRYKAVAADLPFSHTVVAHIAKDGHYYIHPDIKQLRSLSVREAARLQSFPDNYYFEGSMTSRFMQIGNAVPPLMSEKIAEKIKVMLK